ncbi:alpha/beta-hydrolase [Acephala macrosclerotiorum]|nr:alpha/beta-hydrolase [Acephala macrosclerotiorum]
MQLPSPGLLLWPLVQASLAASTSLGVTKNGMYFGLSIPQFKRDFVRGIPYAKPPTGGYRFRYPRSLNGSFSGVRNATQIGCTCPGKDNATLYALNEDCLNLNIVRPSGCKSSKGLSVLVQLFGGAGDPRRLAFPSIIAVLVNFRKAAFGFLAGRDVVENIAGFGGNPDEVTIMGQSSGGDMVTRQINAYGGGGGKAPFQAGIAMSGSSNAIAISTTLLHARIALTLAINSNAFVKHPTTPSMQPNRTSSSSWSQAETLLPWPAVVQRNLVFSTQWHSRQVEASTKATPSRCKTEADIITHGLQQGSGYTISNKTWEAILKLYPDDPVEGIPAFTGGERFAEHGYMFKRQNVISGNVIFNSNSRQDARVMTAAGMPPRQRISAAYLGAGHVTNQPFGFNLPDGNFSLPWIGPGEARAKLREMTSAMTVAFVVTLNPNMHGRNYTYWPAYNESVNGMNFMSNATGSWLSEDNSRKEAID